MTRILVIGVHPDDAELGMGGTISLLAGQGHDILICDLTDGCPTPRGDRATRLAESAAALEALQPGAGKPRLRRILLDLPNRTLAHTVEARHAVAGAIRAHQAGIVFAPHWEDAHPDHVAAARICEDARFDAKLTKVEMPVPPGFDAAGPPIYPRWFFWYDASHLRRVAPPAFCIDITGHERKKQAAVRAYASQFGGVGAGGPAPDPSRLVSADFPERLLAIAQFWGHAIGTAYAEPFYTKEPLGLNALAGLVL